MRKQLLCSLEQVRILLRRCELDAVALAGKRGPLSRLGGGHRADVRWLLATDMVQFLVHVSGAVEAIFRSVARRKLAHPGRAHWQPVQRAAL